ncbi:MAG: disulfide bond chaperone [Bdellovibrionaceae bacterium]|nr:disulfide bond chaperone [Pseudobdellovibrionaceae bacterium]
MVDPASLSFAFALCVCPFPRYLNSHVRARRHPVRSYFVRKRNALAVEADLSSLYIDYYLHGNDVSERPEPHHDAIFKELLACMLLHACSKPWNEMFAWTLNIQEPRVNLFVTADNSGGSIVGRIFTEHVKEAPQNLFICETVRGGQTPYRSIVEFEGTHMLATVEHFYQQSEQRTARLFETAPEQYLLVSAQPDCDLAWLRNLTLEQAADLHRLEELGPLEKRHYQWQCGCTPDRMLGVAATVTASEGVEALFEGGDSLWLRCPRCGKIYTLTRETARSPPPEKKLTHTRATSELPSCPVDAFWWA